jgi:hypothetical protein
MTPCRTEVADRDALRRQLLRDDRFAMDAMVIEQLTQSFPRGMSVTPLLDRHIQALAFIVSGAPPPHLLSTDPDAHLRPTPTIE